MRKIEKASGRQAGSAASGTREWKGDDRRPLFLYQTPLVARPHFQSSTLTESLQQARNTERSWLYLEYLAHHDFFPLDCRSSILDSWSLILDPWSSVLGPRSSILDPWSSILFFQETSYSLISINKSLVKNIFIVFEQRRHLLTGGNPPVSLTRTRWENEVLSNGGTNNPGKIYWKQIIEITWHHAMS